MPINITIHTDSPDDLTKVFAAAVLTGHDFGVSWSHNNGNGETAEPRPTIKEAFDTAVAVAAGDQVRERIANKTKEGILSIEESLDRRCPTCHAAKGNRCTIAHSGQSYSPNFTHMGRRRRS